MNRKIVYAALALAVAAAGTAFAQQNAAGPQSAPRVKLDANGDGVIDRNEAAKSERFAARFDQMDKNKDGKLTADERPQWSGRHGGHRGGRMMQADKDGDGRISKAEAAAEPKFAERFDKMDTNKDGFVDRADREQMGREHREKWFADADANKDGKLSKAEMDGADAKRRAEFQQKRQASSAERFQRMDKNGDGSISRDEMQAPRIPKH